MYLLPLAQGKGDLLGVLSDVEGFEADELLPLLAYPELLQRCFESRPDDKEVDDDAEQDFDELNES